MASPRRTKSPAELAEEKRMNTMSQKEFGAHIKVLINYFNAIWKARNRVSRGYEVILPGGKLLDSKAMKGVKTQFVNELKRLKKIHKQGPKKMSRGGVEKAAKPRKVTYRELLEAARPAVTAMGAQVGANASGQGLTTRDNLKKIFFAWGAAHKLSNSVATGRLKKDGTPQTRQETVYNLAAISNGSDAIAQAVAQIRTKQGAAVPLSAVPMHYIGTVAGKLLGGENPNPGAQWVAALAQEDAVLSADAARRANASLAASKAKATMKRRAEAAQKKASRK